MTSNPHLVLCFDVGASILWVCWFHTLWVLLRGNPVKIPEPTRSWQWGNEDNPSTGHVCNRVDRHCLTVRWEAVIQGAV